MDKKYGFDRLKFESSFSLEKGNLILAYQKQPDGIVLNNYKAEGVKYYHYKKADISGFALTTN